MNLQEKKQYVNENIKYVPEEELRLFNYNFACVFTMSSSCIEGNNPVKVEEVVSITKGHNVKMDESLKRSIYNHFKTYQYMVDAIEKNIEFNEDFVKDLHEMLLDGIINGGLYRNINLSIKGSNHTPCDYIKVYDRMKKYYDTLAFYEGTDIQKAAYAHLQIAKVHPFLDGNGRLARLVMNYMLIKAGYLPINVPRRDMQVYFNLLEEFKVNKTQVPFEEFIEVRLNREYDRLIAIIDRYKDKTEK